MRRTLARFLVALAKNPFVEAIVGLSLIVVSLEEFAEVVETELEGGGGVQGHHGVLLLGVVLFLKALGAFCEGTMILHRSATPLLSKRAPISNPFFVRMRNILSSPGCEMTVGLILVIAGWTEATEALLIEEAHLASFWSIGVVIMGISFLARSATALAKGVALLINAEERRETPTRFHRVVLKLDTMVRSPKVELSVGVSLLSLCIWEQLHNEFTEILSTMEPHHGLLVMGTHRIIKFAPAAFDSFELVEEAVVEPEAEHAGHHHHDGPTDSVLTDSVLTDPPLAPLPVHDLAQEREHTLSATH